MSARILFSTIISQYVQGINLLSVLVYHHHVLVHKEVVDINTQFKYNFIVVQVLVHVIKKLVHTLTELGRFLYHVEVLGFNDTHGLNQFSLSFHDKYQLGQSLFLYLN